MASLLDLGPGGIIVPETPEPPPPADLPEPNLLPDEDPPPAASLLDLAPIPQPVGPGPALDLALDGNPDEAARNQKLSEESGLSIDAVEIDPDQVQRAQDKRQIESLLDLAPVTRRVISDPRKAQVTHDIIPDLAKAEQITGELGFFAQIAGPGIDKLQALGFRALDFLGEVTGHEAIEAIGEKGAIREFAEVARTSDHIQIIDVQNQEDLQRWLKSLGADVPSLAPGLLASLAALGIGAAVGAAAVPLIIGSIVAAFIPSLVLGIGEVQQGVKERGGEQAEAAGAVLLGGTLIALLDSALPGFVGSKLLKGFGREAGEQIIKLSVAKVITRTAAEGGKGFALEGVTEAFQEAIGEVSAAVGTGTEIDSGELAEQMVEAFARGAMLGGGTTSTINVVVEANRARKVKQSMDKLHRLKKEGKPSLKDRSPKMDADLTEAQMKAAGINEVLVPVDVVLQYINTHPELLPAEALAQLGDVSNLEGAIQATILGGDTNVRIDVRAFSEAILGTEGYTLMAPFFKLTQEQQSFAESAEAVGTFISEEETEKILAAELEAYDAADELKQKVEETLTKIKTDPLTALTEIEADTELMLKDLLNKVIERTKVKPGIEIEGRVAQLDQDIARENSTIAQLDEELERVETENETRSPSRQLSTQKIQRKIDKAIERRDALVEQQQELEVPPAEKAALVPEMDEAQALLDKQVSLRDPKQPLSFFLPKVLKRAREQIRNSHSRTTVVFMSPTDFLALAADEISEEKTARVNEFLDSADTNQFENFPSLGVFMQKDGTAKVDVHEGRHRARAMAARGVQSIPVWITVKEGGPALSIRFGETNRRPTEFIPQAGAADRNFRLIYPGEATVEQLTLTKPQVDIPAAPARGKFVKVKAKVLEDLGVDITVAASRGFQAGVTAGLKVSEGVIKGKTAVHKALEAIPGLKEINEGKVLQRLINRVNKAVTFPQLRRVAATVQSRALDAIAKEQQTQIRKAIEKIVKANQPKVQAGKLRGKDADRAKLFVEAKKILDMKKDDADAALELELAENEPNPATLFRRQLLAVAARQKDLNPTDAENLLIDLSKIAEEANVIALERATGKATARDERIEFAKQAQGKAGNTRGGFARQLKKRIRLVDSWITNSSYAWDDVLDIIINKAGLPQDQIDSFIRSMRITEQIQNAKARGMKWERQFAEVGYEAFGIKEGNWQELQEKFVEDSKPLPIGKFMVEVEDPKTGEIVQQEIDIDHSKSEIRKLWMEFQDPTLRRIIQDPLGMGFNAEILNRLFYTLDQQDIRFAEQQLAMYKKLYPQVNKVYRKIYGVDLPFNEFYSPVQRELGTAAASVRTDLGVDMILTDERKFRRSIPNALRTRTQNLEHLKRRSDVGSMARYINDMAWFIETHERVQEIKAVFTDNALLIDIKNTHTQGMVSLIEGYLEDFGTGFSNRGIWAEKVFGFANRMFTSTTLSIPNFKIFAKQLGSYFAMMDNVPAAFFINAQLDFFKSRKNAIKIVKFLYKSSPGFAQSRGSSVEFDMARVGEMEEQMFKWKKSNVWEKVKFAAVRMGDRFPIYAGGWAVYKYAVTPKSEGGLGLSHSEGIRRFEDAASTTQQSNDIDKQSAVQRMGPLGKTLSMFMTSRLSLLRGEIRAIRQFKRGKIDGFEFGKRIALYHFAIPMFIQFIASGYRIDKDRQLIAAVLGNVNSVVILGDILQWAVIGLMKELNLVEDDLNTFDPDTNLSLINLSLEIGRGINSALDHLEGEEFFRAFLDVVAGTSVAFGVPGPNIKNFLGGAEQVYDGDVEIGLRRMFSESLNSAQEAEQRDFIE